jgi:hypothetical protein
MPVDSGPSGPQSCGSQTCAASQYCNEFQGGPAPPPDSGPSGGFTCAPLPAACVSNPTCACLKANGATVCTCVDENGHPHNTCQGA